MTNITFRPGWNPTPPARPRVRLNAVLDPSAVAVPATVDHLSAVKYVGMMLNDYLGCCTCSSDGHIVQGLTTYGQGHEVDVPDSAVLLAYEAAGYDPNAPLVNGQNPTDQGWTVPDALSYLRRTGMDGHKIAFYGQVPVSDTRKVALACYEFGYLSIGLNLPNSAMAQFNEGPAQGHSRPVWSLVPNDGGNDGGHCVAVCGINSTGPVAWTWGASVQMTWGFWHKYVEEAWAVISRDWVNSKTGTDPIGVNLAVLGQEVQSVLGTNPFVPVKSGVLSRFFGRNH
jgi:hypothetical protein